MGCVVVGVDGSDASMDALRFAASEARLRHAPLRVVIAMNPPVDDASYAEALRDPAQMERATQRTVDSMVTAVGGELTGVEVERLAVVGGAAAALLDNCDDADLVVVGSRGRGGFKGLLLGSVSQQVVLHAPCPVTVVRHPIDR